MYRIVYEIDLRGEPKEIDCLVRLHELLKGIAICTGSTTSFVCFYKNVVVKLVPKSIDRVHKPSIVYETPLQSIPINIIIESRSAKYIPELLENVYNFVKSCGLMMRLVE